MEGSPWKVGTHAVLMKKYDADVPPSQVVFDRMAIWARILNLPSRLMNSDRGTEIAKPIGLVKKVESDELGRCWGPYMRVRVEIAVQEPLLRFISVYSSRLQTTARYEVQYERLPFYCFSCGLLGHSTLVCENPADRDENGVLPYHSKRISVPDVKKAGGSKSNSNATSTGEQPSTGGSTSRKNKGVVQKGDQNEDHDVSSPLNPGRGGGRGRTRGRGRGRGRTEGNHRELFPETDPKQTTAGQKRKAKNSNNLAIEEPSAQIGPLALTMVAKKGTVVAVEDDVTSTDSNKKLRSTPSRSADPAEAAEQPRQTQ
ncbi:hypothetical protein QYE76_036034 [Lolium multiflorum]|uniref:Zinc knuckle CX2CX4HX4C domain-containing protein n=1 Tax=Lolium multiflorum TaxID=4521 RepID=A0AAD8R0Y8_LOLMU|nr:hypothetical protein QYE76_036034 [Lolium multiflorum]